MTTIHDLPTPALVLDLDRLEGNLDRMAALAGRHGLRLRPHAKTHKSVEVAELQRALGAEGLTVATLTEARVFAGHGFQDLTWAFPVILHRLDEARELAERIRLGVVADSREAIAALAQAGRFSVWLKVDCGYHRAGVEPEGALPLELARAIADAPNLRFAGILTHSGHAYGATSREAMAAVARQEQTVMAELAARLEAAGLAPPQVSIGSTPGLSAAGGEFRGITEIRPGNYAFYDFTQVALGSCPVSACAVTVASSVVSANRHRDRSIVDAGALALSKDPGPAGHGGFGEIFQSYDEGLLDPRRRLVSLSQEHGIVNGYLPIGRRVRILPNHSCLTVACFDEYAVVRGDRLVDRWRIHRQRGGRRAAQSI